MISRHYVNTSEPSGREAVGSGEERSFRSLQLSLKAILDFVAAVLLALVIWPLVLLVMLVVKLTSRGPVIYTQTRLGRNGRPFRIFKIRTMRHESEALTGPRWSSKTDPNITVVGHFLRRSHLDELPQLWNILRGEMSLVGPRPERPEFVTRLEIEIPRYRERLAVRPGVTGLAQVQLPPDTDLESVRRKLVCDLAYIDQLGFGLDLRILFCTALGLVGIPYSASRKLFRVPTLVASDVVPTSEPAVLSLGAGAR